MKSKLLNRAEYILMTAILAVFLCVFAYLNIAKFKYHVDSDIAAEALLAREIWTQKTLTPDNWVGSTERYIFGMPTIASLFYGITGSINLATGIACVILGIFFVVSMYLFLRKIGFKRETTVLALLILAALPMNGLENENQIVPFFILQFFLFADWYVLCFCLGLYSFLFYIHLKEKEEYSKKDLKLLIPAFILFVVATVFSAGGMHTVQFGIFPLFVYELISITVDTGLYKTKPSLKRIVPTAYVLSQMLAFFVSTLHHGQAGYGTFIESRDNVVRGLFTVLPSMILKCFGFEGGTGLSDFSGIMHFLILAFMILVVIALVSIFGKKKVGAGDAAASDGKIKEAILFFVSMFGVSAVLMVILRVGEFHYYLFALWFVAALSVSAYVQKLGEEGRGFKDVIIAAVVLFSVLNLFYTYKGAIDCNDNLRSYEEVTDFIKSEGIEYGYAEFWDAGRLASVCDGELKFGCSYTMDDLNMYWWLTNLDWYPPTLPDEMKTAYVVRHGGEDSFLSQFEDPSVVVSSFTNEGFTVYLSDHNFVRRP